MRLVSPAGTVVECEGAVAEKMQSAGWFVDEVAKADEARKRKPGRPKKSE